jgi:hypothetical protein
MMKYNPLSWFFSRPQGSLGRKVMGYYWRMVVLGLVGLFVVFPQLIEAYPEFYLPTRIARETPWPIIAIFHMVLWTFVAFVLSIPLQIVRFVAWLVVGPSAEEIRENNELIKAEIERHEQQRLARLEYEKTVNHIKLTREDTEAVKEIWSLAPYLQLLAVVVGVSVSAWALYVAPGILEEAPQPWSVFAEIINILPLHMVLLGWLIYQIVWGTASSYFSRKETQYVQDRYLWREDVENRIRYHT